MLAEPSGNSEALLDVALGCVSRGWHVFPCWPRTKKPMLPNGWHGATNDEQRVRAWWSRNPDANVAIACNPSGLAVLDIDHGIADAAEAQRVLATMDLPETYTVRTGRRPEYGLQVYFSGAVPDVGSWEAAGCSGQVKSLGGYVMAAGSVHPDSGERYEVVQSAAVAPTPDAVRALRSENRAALPDDGEPITSNRNVRLTSIAGKLRNAGLSGDAIEAALLQTNMDRCDPPLDEDEVKRIAANVSKYKLPEEPIAVTIGGASKNAGGVHAGALHGGQDGAVDAREWRSLFHTRDDIEHSPDPQFLVKDFLQEQSITGLIGPARARKSIIVVNMIHSLLTGEPLFGKLEVQNKPNRVLYLVPESGLLAIGRRLRNMGLSQYVEESLFVTSMNLQLVELDDPRIQEAAKGAVVFVDTMIRFFGGAEENSAADMARFFSKCQSLISGGARAVVVLHHTAKQSDGLRLESGRGSGDFGGSLTAAWGTTLDDYDDAYKSLSLLVPVKERDFRAESFKVAPSGDDTNFFLQYVDGSDNARVQVGAKKKAGNAQAAALARANPSMTAPQLREALKTQGVEYSERTCRDLLRDARSTAGTSGVTLTAA